MKYLLQEFFALRHFRGINAVMIILETIIISLVMTLTWNMNLSYFNLFALLFTAFVYCLCCAVDPKKYFNFATLIVSGIFGYGCFWFMFEIFTRF